MQFDEFCYMHLLCISVLPKTPRCLFVTRTFFQPHLQETTVSIFCHYGLVCISNRWSHFFVGKGLLSLSIMIWRWILAYGCIIHLFFPEWHSMLHMYSALFVYPFTCLWTSGLFQCSHSKYTALHICVWSSRGHMLSILLRNV